MQKSAHVALWAIVLTACSTDDQPQRVTGRDGSTEAGDGGGGGAAGAPSHGNGGGMAAGGASPHGNGGTSTGGARATGGHEATPDAHAPREAGAPEASRPVVAACDGLGKVDEFEDITPPQTNLMNEGVANVLLDPLHAGTVYASTDKRGLFKSTNCGADWTKINTGRNAAILDSGTLWSMAIDPVDPNVMYAGSLYGSDLSLFKSTNGGVDWDATYAPGSEIPITVEYNFFQDLSLDPTDPHHIVLTFHANCKGAYAPSCLAETKDAGATWRLFKSPLDSWGEGAAPRVLGPTSWLLGTEQSGIYYTNDSGAHWEKVGPGMNGPMYHSRVTGVFYSESDYGLLQSVDGGHQWTLVPGAPKGNAIIGDGERLFIGQRVSDDQKQGYYTSAETDGKTWKPFASPKMDRGGNIFGYDAAHHLLYSANTASGLWRIVTK